MGAALDDPALVQAQDLVGRPDRRQAVGDHQQGAVAGLVGRVEREMMEHGAGLVLCGYSGDWLTTSVFVQPDWPSVLTHVPSLLTFLGLFATVGGAGAGLVGVLAWTPRNRGSTPAARRGVGTAPADRRAPSGPMGAVRPPHKRKAGTP